MKYNKQIISLVIPAYKQERSIQRDIRRINGAMKELGRKYEIIVVIDGISADGTYKKAKRLESSKVKVIGYGTNHGKGHAVRYGMANSKGDIVAFLDSGMDINPGGLSMLLAHFEWYNADIIVGSKRHPVSRVKYPLQRKILSEGYRFITKILFGLSIKDTQAGIKFYKRGVLERVLPRLLVKHYAFDIEILAVAHRLGFKKIYEAPIELSFKGPNIITSKSFWGIAILMLRDNLAVFYRLKILKYYDDDNKRRWRYDPELNFRVNLP